MNPNQPSRTRRIALVAVSITLSLGLAMSVYAAKDLGALCAASKQKAAAKKFSDKVKCHGKAIKKGVAVDPACLTKAETKYQGAFTKAEGKGGCLTTGDVGDIETLMDDTLADLLEAIPATTTTTTTSTLP